MGEEALAAAHRRDAGWRYIDEVDRLYTYNAVYHLSRDLFGFLLEMVHDTYATPSAFPELQQVVWAKICEQRLVETPQSSKAPHEQKDAG